MSVTFPSVLRERCGRGRRGFMMFRELLVSFVFMVFLVGVGRREDTYGDRDSSFKVQDASLSDLLNFLPSVHLSEG